MSIIERLDNIEKKIDDMDGVLKSVFRKMVALESILATSNDVVDEEFINVRTLIYYYDE